MTPERLLHIALKYKQVDWIEGPVIQLSARLTNLELPAATLIGIVAYHSIVGVRAELETRRREMAYNAPPPVLTECTRDDESRCELAWRQGWWVTFGAALLHPMHRQEPSACFEVMSGATLSGIPGMCAKCARLTMADVQDIMQVAKLEETTSLLGAEEMMIAKRAAEELKERVLNGEEMFY